MEPRAAFAACITGTNGVSTFGTQATLDSISPPERVPSSEHHDVPSAKAKQCEQQCIAAKAWPKRNNRMTPEHSAQLGSAGDTSFKAQKRPA